MFQPDYGSINTRPNWTLQHTKKTTSVGPLISIPPVDWRPCTKIRVLSCFIQHVLFDSYNFPISSEKILSIEVLYPPKVSFDSWTKYGCGSKWKTINGTTDVNV